MTNEERDIIGRFIARVGGAPATSGFAPATSVPATQGPALPPVDRDADTLIGQLFQQYPEARYRMTQLAFVQEQGLIQAQNRIQQLEADLARATQATQAAQAAQQQAAQPAQQPAGGGFFGGLFGGGSRPQTPPQPGPWGNQGAAPPPQQYAPQPQYAPQSPPQFSSGYQPGMFQRQGGGFLASALTTAAGVAGGIAVGNMLTNMFTGGHHGGGWGEPYGGGGMAGNPWGAPPPVPVQDQGAWDNSAAAAPPNQDYTDSGSWDQQPAQDASFTDNSGGSWDTGGGDSGSIDTGGDSGSFDSGGGDSGSNDTF